MSVSGMTSTNGITNSGNITTDTLTTTGNASIGGSLNMNNNQIHNVADGTAPGDAVNKRQLDALEQKLSAGVASAAALGALPMPAGTKQMAVGVAAANYNGQTAVAVGGTFRQPYNAGTANLTFRFGAGFADRKSTITGAIGLSW